MKTSVTFTYVAREFDPPKAKKAECWREIMSVVRSKGESWSEGIIDLYCTQIKKNKGMFDDRVRDSKSINIVESLSANKRNWLVSGQLSIVEIMLTV